jgi:hypothetical protein
MPMEVFGGLNEEASGVFIMDEASKLGMDYELEIIAEEDPNRPVPELPKVNILIAGFPSFSFLFVCLGCEDLSLFLHASGRLCSYGPAEPLLAQSRQKSSSSSGTPRARSRSRERSGCR